ncbi:DUF805 domain-containing protein [Limnobacter humi]|uniref:DUF805 domain-containing protein n=1 Tax=Limnobacter humi TaxID=1778671 RepID=A0ABT1WKG8_9BURK|nr:DUF805 domain-containing protein [Limnobacter humi]MCQ8897533.1 DUF805 domain-containing protein [Limnobacter humi]
MFNTLFSFSGTVSRSRYLVATLSYYLVVMAIYFMVFAGAVAGAVKGSFGGLGFSFLLGFLMYGSLLWASIALSIKRCRDAGLHPVLVVLFLLFGPLMWLFLCIYGGDRPVVSAPATQATPAPATLAPETVPTHTSVTPAVEAPAPVPVIETVPSKPVNPKLIMGGAVAIVLLIALVMNIGLGNKTTAPVVEQAEPAQLPASKPSRAAVTTANTTAPKTNTPSQQDKAKLKQANRSLDDLLRQ